MSFFLCRLAKLGFFGDAGFGLSEELAEGSFASGDGADGGVAVGMVELIKGARVE